MGLDTNTYWLSDRQSQCDFDFDLNRQRIEEVKRSTMKFSWKSEYFQWGVQSDEDDSVSDSDLWTL
jgi:hypothetical protein